MFGHNQMVRSRICMSKIVDLSNMLFSTVYFVFTWTKKKVFLINLNNLDQF